MKRICFFLIYFLLSLLFANLCFAEDQKYALVIGITGYPHFPQSKRLQFADDDAKLFYDFIITEKGGNFPSVNIRFLYNYEATRENIVKEINWLSQRVTSEDLVYIFFAGHGWVDDNTGLAYFMPYDAKPKYPEDKGFRTDRFVEMLRIQVNSKYLILFSDACHSGSVYSSGLAREGRVSNITSAFNEAWKKAFKGLDAICMAFLAASSNQQSYEDPNLRHGLFTWYLVEGMRGAADGAVTGKKDGVVNAGELYRYVLDKVEYHAIHKLNKEQSPTKSPEFTTSFPFAVSGISGKQLVSRAEESRKHFNRGRDLYDKHDFNGAIIEYREAIRIDPNFIEAHNNLGIALYYKRDIDGAIREIKEAIRIDPNYRKLHSNLASMLEAKGDYNGAIREYKEAGYDSEVIRVHNKIAKRLLDQGDIDGAIREYKEALLTDPDDIDTHNKFGLALRKKGDLNGAIREYKEALRRLPDDPEALYNLACVYSLQNKKETALDFMEKLLLYAHYFDLIKANSDFDNIRNTKRFEKLMQEHEKILEIQKELRN